MIALVDYGAGNLSSVANTLHALGASFQLVEDAGDLGRADKIILPGVGHFGQMMRSLDAMGVREALAGRVRDGVPFLGICLGMQALFEGSDEAPGVSGLGIFPGRAQRFPEALRVPHMGWNQVRARADSLLFRDLGSDPWFYFAHSYYVPRAPVTAGECDYSVTYSAAIERGQTFGVQFHPEKSAAAGQALVDAFLRL